MPPAASFLGSMSQGAILDAPKTPSSASGTIARSPFATTQLPAFSPTLAHSNGINGISPSPAKKKISLSDYKARMKRHDATTHVTTTTAAAKPVETGSPAMAPTVLKALPANQVRVLDYSTMTQSPEESDKTVEPLAQGTITHVSALASPPVPRADVTVTNPESVV